MPKARIVNRLSWNVSPIQEAHCTFEEVLAHPYPFLGHRMMTPHRIMVTMEEACSKRGVLDRPDLSATELIAPYSF